jgi:hypothetical protein
MKDYGYVIGCGCGSHEDGEDKKMTHRTDYGMMNDRPMLPRDDTAISDTTNKANETGLIIRQPL